MHKILNPLGKRSAAGFYLFIFLGSEGDLGAGQVFQRGQRAASNLLLWDPQVGSPGRASVVPTSAAASQYGFHGWEVEVNSQLLWVFSRSAVTALPSLLMREWCTEFIIVGTVCGFIILILIHFKIAPIAWLAFILLLLHFSLFLTSLTLCKEVANSFALTPLLNISWIISFYCKNTVPESMALRFCHNSTHKKHFYMDKPPHILRSDAHRCLLTDLAGSVGATSQIELLIKSSGKDCQNVVWCNERMRLPVSLMNSLVKGAKEFPGSFGPFQVCLYLSNTKILFNGIILTHQENTDTHAHWCAHTLMNADTQSLPMRSKQCLAI